MKLDHFFQHHGIVGNPFSEEDAQTDTVFKRRCLATVHHPAWSKFFGSPADPSTALVFGEKGSGKTALRLQAESELESHNQSSSAERVFVISYDDFNPYLANCKTATGMEKMDDVLEKWRLEDHMDAILSLGVTKLVDQLTSEKINLTVLSVDKRRDLLLLTALYDASTKGPIVGRWGRLRRQSGFRPLWTRRDLQIGFGTTLIVIALIALIPSLLSFRILPWLIFPILAGWLYWGWRLIRAEWFARDIRKGQRVLSRDPAALRWELLWFKPSELGGQPLPTASKRGAEERFGLLRKLQAILQTLGFAGIIVLIDRVDEPQQVEGDPRKMRSLIWPLLDHKFLRHPGIGVKLLLPIELAYFLEKEDKEFYDRARPDKLNLIKPLRWTGASLYDLAGDRLGACRTQPSANGQTPRLRQLIDDAVSDDYLKDALGNLRTPRHLFKFLQRLFEEHCHRHTDDAPRWTIDYDTFRSIYGDYMRELEAFDRGYGHG
jgi:hypothetical protein